jgi:hypothetical protein
MLDTQEQVATSARDRTALAYLRVGLDEAVASGVATAVRWIPTSHTDRELVALATGLCVHRAEKVIVLGGGAITFVPLK